MAGTLKASITATTSGLFGTGGDELNLIQPGKNYGWPSITYGIDYNGSIISPFKIKDGMEQPIKFWTPSIAPSDMTFYNGNLFPDWFGSIFISALSPGDVRRMVFQDDEIIVFGMTRVHYGSLAIIMTCCILQMLCCFFIRISFSAV